MAKYRHMLSGDVAIWERFLVKYPNVYESLQYDVHVGEGLRDQAGVTDEVKYASMELLLKRIDVVGKLGAETHIIEVKPDAGMSAVGQVLCYEVLYRRDFKKVGLIKRVIVTDRLWPDEEYLFKVFNILCYVV